MRRPSWLNANTAIGTAALFTSFVAVVVAIEESRLMRRSQEASFMPLMEVRSTLSTAPEDLRVIISLRNSGHGVAFVEDTAFAYDGEPLEDYSAFSGRVLNEKLSEAADFSFASSRGYFEPGEERDVLIFRWEDNEENRQELETFLRTKAAEKAEALSVFLCYCSVFGSCFVREGSDEATRPRTVSACKGKDDPVQAYWRSYNALQETTDE